MDGKEAGPASKKASIQIEQGRNSIKTFEELREAEASRLRNMGHNASRLGMMASGLRAGRPAWEDGRVSEIESYNNSSLAVDLEADALPMRAVEPQAIPRRFGPSSVRREPLMFQGLDKTAFNRGRKSSTTFSFILHLGIIAGVLYLGTILRAPAMRTEATLLTPLHFTLYDPPPPIMPIAVAKVPTGGGGGGEHHLIAPKRAPMPKIVRAQPIAMAPPRIVEHPKLTIEPSAPVRMPDSTQTTKIGMPNSPQVALASQGSGSASGFGFGMGGGFGSGNGNGMGKGSGGAYGGGVMSVGGGVSAPVVIHSVDPNFTDEARRANFQGMAAIQLIVDSQGVPQAVHSLRHLGMGLDEKAIEAVKQYRFKPAMFQGHAVAVQMVIEVDFRLH